MELFPDRQKNAADISEEWTVMIYDYTIGKKITTMKCKGMSTTIDCSGWMSGIYIVKAFVRKHTLTEKINI